MQAIIKYVIIIFNNIVEVMNIRIFSDFPVTYLQLLLCCFVIGVVFKFLFIQQNEIDIQTNWINRSIMSKGFSSIERKAQVIRRKREIDRIVGPYKGPTRRPTKKERAEMEALLSEYK